VLLFTPLEAYVEGVLALILVAAVVVGFSLHPKKDVYYVQTTRRLREPSGKQALEKDFVAVKVELVRLWVLFVPTFLAIAYLIASSANGVLWKFSFLNWLTDSRLSPLLIILREFALLMALMLQAWIGERWVLRDAEASNADSYTHGTMQVTYAFYDQQGVIYGGDCIRFDLVRPIQLAKIVFYNPRKPDVNKIAMAFLFHRPVILAHGLTDLNTQTVAAQQALAEIRSRPLAPGEI
jgi:hypothetical protein